MRIVQSVHLRAHNHMYNVRLCRHVGSRLGREKWGLVFVDLVIEGPGRSSKDRSGQIMQQFFYIPL